MKTSIKVGLTVVVSILLLLSAYTIFFSGAKNQTNDSQEESQEEIDSLPPTITSISGDVAADAGDTITISTDFSDNIGVMSAKLFYRPAEALAWSSKSILAGNASLALPMDSNESWFYYVTVEDAAGNGPIGDPSVDGSSFYTITVHTHEQSPPDDNETTNGDGNNNQDYSRFVFVELGTKIVCSECPKVSVLLDDLYKSDDYPFYYVSLPLDNPKALARLNEYNILGYPTVYIDGGYKVLVGSKVQKSDFEKNITSAAARVTPRIMVSTTAQWNNRTDIITVNVLAMNNEVSSYSGRLRVYITEIISTQWKAGTPEYFSFLDFLINQDIQILGNHNISFTKTLNASDLDPENLMLFSVLFSAETQNGYSQPPDKNSFDAHYVDAVSATRVINGGNLPPEVGIQTPLVKYLHRFGKPIRTTISGKTIVVGKTTILASANDDSKITKVEFYINDKLMATVTQEPYQWLWHRVSFGKKTITVKSYDDTGKTTTARIDVIAFML
jgi:hypothetical protein